MLVGAGTVITIKQVDDAISAGAKFIVSPGLNPKIVRYCKEKDITILPGTSNPSDLEKAIELGLDVVKFFPAEAVGGIKMIKAMSAPYNKIRFMPTGGISVYNLIDYLDFDKVVACGGSWMVKQDLIEKKKFDKIESLAKEAVMTMLGFEIEDIIIESSSENNHVDIFKTIFECRKNYYDFSNDLTNSLKDTEDKMIAKVVVSTNYLDRALHYLENRGFVFDDKSKKYEDNKLQYVSLKDTIGGIRVCFVEKNK